MKLKILGEGDSVIYETPTAPLRYAHQVREILPEHARSQLDKATGIEITRDDLPNQPVTQYRIDTRRGIIELLKAKGTGKAGTFEYNTQSDNPGTRYVLSLRNYFVSKLQ